jgi:hypothetical protein
MITHQHVDRLAIRGGDRLWFLRASGFEQLKSFPLTAARPILSR